MSPSRMDTYLATSSSLPYAFGRPSVHLSQLNQERVSSELVPRDERTVQIGRACPGPRVAIGEYGRG
jgi:hypothetical protein